jgi:hypothetical protein
MILLDDEAQVEASFSPFGDSGSVDARKLHGLSNVASARKSCWTHPMKLLGELWNLVLVRLETVLLSVQHMSRVCAECTIGLEIILDTPNDTPR